MAKNDVDNGARARTFSKLNKNILCKSQHECCSCYWCCCNWWKSLNSISEWMNICMQRDEKVSSAVFLFLFTKIEFLFPLIKVVCAHTHSHPFMFKSPDTKQKQFAKKRNHTTSFIAQACPASWVQLSLCKEMRA